MYIEDGISGFNRSLKKMVGEDYYNEHFAGVCEAFERLLLHCSERTEAAKDLEDLRSECLSLRKDLDIFAGRAPTMPLKMNLKHTAPIDELIHLHPSFSELKGKSVWGYDMDTLQDYFSGVRTTAPKDDTYRWEVPHTNFFGYQDQATILPVMFIGKTGYGKSSLLNRITGTNLFPIDDIRPCTKEIDAAVYRLREYPSHFLALCDLPGVGENEQADRQYMGWYSGLLECSPCVVYVLRADQRDFSVDERVFQTLFLNEETRDKVIIALSYADKIEPINRGSELSEAQLDALERKVDQVSELFSIPSYRIFPYCAHTSYGVKDLVNEISENLEMCVFDED